MSLLFLLLAFAFFLLLKAFAFARRELGPKDAVARAKQLVVGLHVRNVGTVAREHDPIEELSPAPWRTTEHVEVFGREQDGRNTTVKVDRRAHELAIDARAPSRGSRTPLDSNLESRAQTQAFVDADQFDTTGITAEAQKRRQLGTAKRA